jgi:hypothetical protein
LSRFGWNYQEDIHFFKQFQLNIDERAIGIKYAVG